jgi:hypothetical protein
LSDKESRTYATNSISPQLALIAESEHGKRGKHQQVIAKKGIEIVSLLLKKNMDYGSSAWSRPLLAPNCDAGTAIRVRMSDKISRMVQLLSSEAQVDESITDTELDLVGYLILDLGLKELIKSEQE